MIGGTDIMCAEETLKLPLIVESSWWKMVLNFDLFSLLVIIILEQSSHVYGKLSSVIFIQTRRQDDARVIIQGPKQLHMSTPE